MADTATEALQSRRHQSGISPGIKEYSLGPHASWAGRRAPLEAETVEAALATYMLDGSIIIAEAIKK
jgi:hypothetical protein